jgi:hypothetical protein
MFVVCFFRWDETAVDEKDKKGTKTLQVPEGNAGSLLSLLKSDRQFVVWLFFSLMEESTKPISFSPESLSQYQPMGRAQMRSAPRVSLAANHVPPRVHFDDNGRACRWVFRRCGIRLLNERIPFPCWRNRLEVGIVLVGEGHVGGGLHLLLVLLENSLVDLDLWGSEGGGSDKVLGKRLATRDICEKLRTRRTRVWLPTSFLASHRKGFSKL